MRKALEKLLLTAIICVPGMGLYASDLIPDQNAKGKWGYTDESGKKVIDYKYDEASFFVNGTAKVRKGDNYGFISKSDTQVIPIKYNTIEPFNDHIYKVSTGGKYKDGVLFNEKYGFIDVTGKILLNPEYEEIGLFSDGVAYIHKGNLYGYINDKIEVIIPCKYKAVGSFNEEGYVWVNDGCSFEKNSTVKIKGGKFGIYNKSGKIIVEPKYKTAGYFVPYVYTHPQSSLDKMNFTEQKIATQCGTHRLLRKYKVPTELFGKIDGEIYGFYGSNKDDASKNSIVTKTGEVLVDAGKYDHVFYPEEGFAVVIRKQKYNFLNISTGKLLLKKDVSTAWSFQSGKAVVTNGDVSYLIDQTGKEATAAYTDIYPRKENVYIIRSNNGYGLLDKDGKEILPPNKYSIFPPSLGLMRIQEQKDQPIGYIDTSGKYKIEAKYINGTSFEHGYASVKTSDGWGEIAPSGKEVIKCRWADITQKTIDNTRYLWVKKEKDGPWYAIDLATDNIIFPEGYNWVRNFDNDFKDIAVAGTDDSHIGCIDTKGNVIIPFEMPNGTMAIKAYKQLTNSGKQKWEAIDTYRLKLYNNEDRNKSSLFITINSSLWDY